MLEKCRMNRAAAIAAALLSGLVLLPDGRSEGYRNPPPNAAGVGTAGAGYAWTDGAAAIVYNPAGLLDLEATQAQFSVTATRLGTTFEPAAGGGLRLSSREEWNFLPNIFVGGPSDNGAWSWGLGIATPYGQSMKWREDDPAPWRYMRPYEASMFVLETSPAVAMRIGERVSLGMALSFYMSELEFDQQVPGAQMGAPGGPDGMLRFDGDADAVGGSAGLHWDASDALRIAISYKAPVRLRYSGDVRIVHPGLPPMLPDGAFRTTIELPDIVAGAVGLRVSDAVRLEASVEHLRWSRFEEQAVSVRSPLPVPEQRMPQRWEDTWTAGVGGTWSLDGGWTLHGGYRFMQSPIPDETYGLVLPDADRHVLGIGIGYERGPHRFDAAWSHNVFRSRSISGNLNPAVDGRHTYDADLAGWTYRYSF